MSGEETAFLWSGATLVLVLAAVKIIRSSILRKRRERLPAIAEKLGLRFRPEEDRALADRWRFLETFLRLGEIQPVFNIFEGQCAGHNVLIFDYSCRERGDFISPFLGLCRTVLIIEFKGAAFPKLQVNPEIFGGIRFESTEFSRRYNVLSNDKKFAYDVFNPQMIEFFIANPGIRIEIQKNALVLDPARLLPPDLIEHELNRLIKIQSLLPEYLFTKEQP